MRELRMITPEQACKIYSMKSGGGWFDYFRSLPSADVIIEAAQNQLEETQNRNTRLESREKEVRINIYIKKLDAALKAVEITDKEG